MKDYKASITLINGVTRVKGGLCKDDAIAFLLKRVESISHGNTDILEAWKNKFYNEWTHKGLTGTITVNGKAVYTYIIE